MKNMNVHKDVDVKELSTATEGASGADIKSICTEAGMFAIRENRDTVLKTDFESAVEKVLKKKEEGTLHEIAGVMYS